MVENKNKIHTFWVENKNFSPNFVFAFEKFVFCCLDPDPDWEENPGSGSVKNEFGSETLKSEVLPSAWHRVRSWCEWPHPSSPCNKTIHHYRYLLFNLPRKWKPNKLFDADFGEIYRYTGTLATKNVFLMSGLGPSGGWKDFLKTKNMILAQIIFGTYR